MASSGYFEVSGMANDQKPVIGWRMNFFIPRDLQDSGFRIRSGITHTGQPNIIIACFSCPPAKDLMAFQPRLSDFPLGRAFWIQWSAFCASLAGIRTSPFGVLSS